jgi:hypothetical protein
MHPAPLLVRDLHTRIECTVRARKSEISLFSIRCVVAILHQLCKQEADPWALFGLSRLAVLWLRLGPTIDTELDIEASWTKSEP